MRVPSTERRSFRVRGWLITAVVLLLVLLFSLRGLATFYTDYLWFDSLGQGDTWGSLLAAKAVPAIVFTVLFFALLLFSLLIADRLAPRFRPAGPATPEDEMLARYQEITARYTGRIRVGVALFFALVAGIGVSARWRDWVLFTHRVDFGIEDPQFGKDAGFYVFHLPFLKFIVDWLFAGLVIVLLVTAVAHYLNGGIRFQRPVQRVTPQVKAHLSVIVALIALVKTADYYLGRFELNFSTRGFVEGAGYTDVKAQLPALNLLIYISIAAAALFIWNIRRRGWTLPVIAVGLWGFVSLVVGTIYPAAIQELRVSPNEFASERAYIERNIEGTRAAYGLSEIKPVSFEFTEDLASDVVDANRPTIDNARLWDPAFTRETYQTLQGLQTYYRINDVDIDRYTVDGETTQVVLSARELNSAELPSKSWVNEHLVFTHGYGVIASPTNASEGDGNPVFYVSDIPPKSEGIGLSEQGARIYFGESLSNYTIVNAKQAEFDYATAGKRDSFTRYRGEDGVALSNIFRRVAFALRFGDLNPLISGQLSGDSKVLMVRDIRERVHKLAPFLDFDDDPYPVVVNGRVVWVLDAYTSSDRYPYSQSATGSGGLAHEVNYVRNSVKAVVDAYDGTATFYVVDRKDPLIRAYREAFPDLFTDMSRMPDELRQHLRFPEDLFTLQSEVYSKYHVTEARRFYSGNERWLLSPDPQALNIVTDGGTGPRRRAGQVEITSTTPRQRPYYLYIRLPGDDHESFLLLQPFVPVSADNKQVRLVSFMTAKSDPDEYGKIETFVMPQGSNVLGPVQVAQRIEQEPSISEQFTLLDRSGSRVRRGNVQLIPVGNSLIYVRPIYIEGETLRFPQFRFVAVLTQSKPPVLASNVNEALNLIFGEGTAPVPTPGTPPVGGTVQELLDRATELFDQAQRALRDGNLGEYQRLIEEVGDLLEEARVVAAGGSPSTTTTTAPAQAAATGGG